MGYRIFSAFNYLFLALLSIVCIIPFIHIIAVSFSDQASSTANSVTLLPIGFNWTAYKKVFTDASVWRSFGVTVLRMVLGTVISMILTITVAFPLSFDSKHFKGRSVYVAFFFFSMIFSGGMVPYYILLKDLKLLDTIWALVLGAVPVGSVIILLNFYRQLPRALFESARLDGASYFQILTKIYFPLSLPSVATLSLMSLVGHWNDWFGGMVYAETKQVLVTTTVSMAGKEVGKFAYADLPFAVTLKAGKTYYILSEEHAGGDMSGMGDYFYTELSNGVAFDGDSPKIYGCFYIAPDYTEVPDTGLGRSYVGLDIRYGDSSATPPAATSDNAPSVLPLIATAVLALSAVAVVGKKLRTSNR